MMKIRVDVDYPYPSRLRSFLYVGLRIKSKKRKDYLLNARILAHMLNESKMHVLVYWFFTPYTVPDKRLLELLKPENHEVALHVATNPEKERKTLEKETGRTLNYYTIHGTKRLIARLLWGRKLSESQAKIPPTFPLKSLHELQTFSLDTMCYETDYGEAQKHAEELISKGYVVSIHPEWLFQKGKRSHRGPYYEVLKKIIDVDRELETLRVRKKGFFKIAQDAEEYEKNVEPTEVYLEKLQGRNIDIFTFIERKWCCPSSFALNGWVKTNDNVGLLEIKNFESWLQNVGKKTRNMIKKAEKSGVKVSVSERNQRLAEGIWRIYNETPIRQDRAFPHYGARLESIVAMVAAANNSTFIEATLEGEIIGFIQLRHGDKITLTSNILSMQKHWDKALNNAMLAKAVEVCAAKGEQWLLYGRIGNHPSLDKFKENNGFVKVPIIRYYVPLTSRGKLAIKLGVHRDFKDSLPDFIKYPLIPTINFISRSKAKAKMRLRKIRS
jgi:hypothetical protein